MTKLVDLEEKPSNEGNPIKGFSPLSQGGSRRTRAIIRGLFSALLALFLLFLVYRNTDLQQLKNYLREGEIKWGLLCIGIAIEALANTLRGIRWRLQMLPLAPPTPRRRIVVVAMWGCYSVNLVLPRMGELWRCWLVSSTEKLSFSAVFGTLVAERLVDLLVMVILIASAFLFFAEEAFFLTKDIAFPGGLVAIFHAPWFYLALIALAILLLTLRKSITRLPLWRRFVHFTKSFYGGLMTIWRMPSKWLFLLLTILIYSAYFMGFYITFYAFPFTHDLGLGIGFLVFIMATLGTAVPVQGGIGTWHFMCISTLVAFGVSSQKAGFFAFLVHGTQTLGIALLGLLAILFVPLLSKQSHKLTTINTLCLKK